jgi:hypothetical protein
MTDTTKTGGGRPWTLSVAATGEIKEGTGSNGAPYMNFRGDIETSKGVKSRSVSVFNTQRFPTLIEDVKAALATGPAKLTLRFDYDKGETVKILGVGHVSFRKPANDVATTDETPVDDQVETPVADTPAVEEPIVDAPVVEEPVATGDPMDGVVVEIKKPRRRRKAA